MHLKDGNQHFFIQNGDPKSVFESFRLIHKSQMDIEMHPVKIWKRVLAEILSNRDPLYGVSTFVSL